jgi:hypothetical protein
MSRLINFALFTPANVIAIGAIVFFWGALAYFAKSVNSSSDVVRKEPAPGIRSELQ